ncbi:nuclear transport factor 2 family protein [Undibacterium sp. SXout20W]|uniref:nuclear transport factor 2 family protein n=1 Tax=Undibacterium sp. SXout20W TaxID=3413051 RepID=UPI003BF2A7AE
MFSKFIISGRRGVITVALFLITSGITLTTTTINQAHATPVSTIQNSTPQINGWTPRAYFEKMMADYFTAPYQSPSEATDKYLTQDAIHEVDGKIVTRKDFIGHVAYLQKNVKSMTFDIKQVIFDGEWFVERHIGRTELKNGEVINSEVAVFFHFINGKIDRAFEMTRPLSGIDSDRHIHTTK